MKYYAIFGALLWNCSVAKDMFFELEDVGMVVYEAPSWAKFAEACEEYMNDREIFGYEIFRMKSNRPLIDAVVNQDIFTREQLLDSVEQEFKTALNEIEQEQKLGNKELSLTWCGRAEYIKPRYIGHYQNMEQIAVDWYGYSGGAHGLSGTSYYLFNQNDQHLMLHDFIKPEALPELQSALMKAYFVVKGVQSTEEYQQQNHCCIELKEGEAPEISIQNALLTDNFYFNAEGINFVYPPYRVASYAEGEITLTIPHESLRDWLK